MILGSNHSHWVLTAICHQLLEDVNCSGVLALTQAERHIMAEQVRTILQGCCGVHGEMAGKGVQELC